MPNRLRKNSGVDAESIVGSAECNSVTGAREMGRVQLGSICRVGMSERGGCVEGVKIRYVRAMSSGARSMAASAEAVTETSRDERGDGDERMSRPPTGALVEGVRRFMVGRPLGSGRDTSAARRERIQVLRVEKRMLWMKVLLVPFQMPQAPSEAQSCEMTFKSEDEGVGRSLCGEAEETALGERDLGRR